jgi:hypothetical protein
LTERDLNALCRIKVQTNLPSFQAKNKALEYGPDPADGNLKGRFLAASTGYIPGSGGLYFITAYDRLRAALDVCFECIGDEEPFIDEVAAGFQQNAPTGCASIVAVR